MGDSIEAVADPTAAGAVRCARLDLDAVFGVCRTCGVPAWRTKRGWVHERRDERLPRAVGSPVAGASQEGYSTRP